MSPKQENLQAKFGKKYFLRWMPFLMQPGLEPAASGLRDYGAATETAIVVPLKMSIFCFVLHFSKHEHKFSSQLQIEGKAPLKVNLVS